MCHKWVDWFLALAGFHTCIALLIPGSVLAAYGVSTIQIESKSYSAHQIVLKISWIDYVFFCCRCSVSVCLCFVCVYMRRWIVVYQTTRHVSYPGGVSLLFLLLYCCARLCCGQCGQIINMLTCNFNRLVAKATSMPAIAVSFYWWRWRWLMLRPTRSLIIEYFTCHHIRPAPSNVRGE